MYIIHIELDQQGETNHKEQSREEFAQCKQNHVVVS